MGGGMSTPVPGGGFTAGPGSFGGTDSVGTWQLVEGADGKVYERNSTTGEVRLAPEQFQNPAERQVSWQQQGVIPLDSWDKRARLPAGSVTGSIGSASGGISSPEARQQALGGGLNFLDSWEVLATAGLPDSLIKDMLLGDSSRSGSGDGVGWANLAQRKAEFAAQQAMAEQAARRQSALDIYDTIAQAQARETEMAQAAKANQLSAMPFAVDPSLTHFPGYGPSDPIVGRYGLTSPVKVQHTPFNPALGPTSVDAKLAEALNVYRQLAGV